MTTTQIILLIVLVIFVIICMVAYEPDYPQPKNMDLKCREADRRHEEADAKKKQSTKDAVGCARNPNLIKSKTSRNRAKKDQGWKH